MEHPGTASISLADVSKLLEEESKNAAQMAWLLANAFGDTRDSALLFFHRILCKTAILYVHHRDFIVAAAGQLKTIFGDDDKSVSSLQHATRIIDGEESTLSSEAMIPSTRACNS